VATPAQRPATWLLAGALAATGCASRTPAGGAELYRSAAFTVSGTAVDQGGFRAVAGGPDRIESNYQRAATEVNFKFSLNGEDNERVPGEDHMIYLRPRDGRLITPVYRFGELDAPLTPEPRLAAAEPEEGPVDVTFRLDLSRALAAWRTAGSYDPPNGPAIAAGDLEGVYVVGNVAPLSWDFGALRPGAPTELHDPDGDGVYEVTLRFAASFARPLTARGTVVWELGQDLSRFPVHTSPQPLVDALHRLALEELLELRNEEGTLDAGGRWPGVWTRDLAWSTLLALALVAPEEVRRGLLARVDEEGRIRQDSGTGGSWPISTDRVAWALAAWELYAASGDEDWLRTAYEVIRRSAEADLAVAFDPAAGLFRGETTFLDWREQSYPRWMGPTDIGTSRALGTNVLHYGAYRVLARMAALLGEPTGRWDEVAAAVRVGLDERLWQPERGHHGAYLYGRWFPSRSPRAELLGESLAVVAGAADGERARRLVAAGPVVPFGVPSFWPYIPDVPAYHNAGVWPQVVGFRAWAAAEVGNTAAVEHALACLYRGAALFLTNKENWVAATGHFEGTEVNSDRFGASIAAQLATVYRVLFGIRLHADRLELRPFVPRAYAGTRTLTNLRYRDATLTLTVHGFGCAPREVRLDGRVIPHAEVPAGLAGAHTLEVTLDERMPEGAVNLVANVAAPATPGARLEGGELRWEPVAGAVRYAVHRNGRRVAVTAETRAPVVEEDGFAEYQVRAEDTRGLASFLGEPVRVGPAAASWPVEAEGTGGTGGDDPGAVRLTTASPALHLAVEIPTAGWYAVDARYANGSGPVSYGDRAAVRTLSVDGRRAGKLLLPQRGMGRWDLFGYSNALPVRLDVGAHTVGVSLEPEDRNMNGAVNEALLDHVRLTRLAEGPPASSPPSATPSLP
jgi:hypothetical protein